MLKRCAVISVAVVSCLFHLNIYSEQNPPRTILASNEKSNYEIVIPVSFDNNALKLYSEISARLIRDCFKDAAGVDLPIAEEDKHDPGKHGIFLGNTSFAQKNGISTKDFADWEYVQKNINGNIIIAGNDYSPLSNVKSTNYNLYVLGTLKGTCSFLENQLGARFVLPGSNGIEIPKAHEISVPADFNVRKKALMQFIFASGTDPVYAIANNYFPSSKIKLYGGHSYYDAVPAEKYFKTNPEYFALSGGKRAGIKNHLCISNPEVQELIYKEMLKQLDAGYEGVELGQTDAYVECECENCKKLYGISDPGEKLWILHRNLAERLLRERPGKKVIILSYGNTVKPPETFREFPQNVMIEMSFYNPSDFEKWKDCKVPGGFMIYAYNWGYYQQVGLTPQRTPRFCGEQASLFLKNKVAGVYLCGFGELFGLQGPAYYVYGQMFEDANLNYHNLANKFYEGAYGKASIPMKTFFNTLYRRLELYSDLVGFRCANDSYIDTNGKRKLYLPDNPRIVLAYIYSPDVIDTMEKNLKRAETVADAPKHRKRIQLVRKEFDYVKNLASIIHLYNAYRITPNWPNFEELATLIEARNKMINGFYVKGQMSGLEGWPNIKFLRGADEATVKVNGRLAALLGAPFNWNTELLKKHKILPGTYKKAMTVKKVNGTIETDANLELGAWKDIPFQELGEIQMGTLREKTKFKILYDDKYLYIGFNCSFPAEQVKLSALGHDGMCWKQECMEIFIDPYGSREKYYHFIFNPVKNSFYEASNGFITDTTDPRFGKDDTSWNCEWTYENFTDSKENKWNSVVKIPFASLSVPLPGNGTAWLMNIGREHFIPDTKKQELSLWSPNLEALNFHEKESFGELIFSEK